MSGMARLIGRGALALVAMLTPLLVTCGNTSAQAAALDGVQWRVLEIEFVSTRVHSAPISVELNVSFVGPAGIRFEVPGFWDGGSSWKVRFTPTLSGEWSYSTSASDVDDAGLSARHGTILVRAAIASDNSIFAHGGFLRVSDNHRYLTYSDGTPFFWLGDAWWFCPSTLCPIDGSSTPSHASMYKSLIDKRKAQGFTVAHMAFMGVDSPLKPPPRQWNLDNLRAWRNADNYFAYANEAGIIPVVGVGFHGQLDEVSIDDLRQIWRYVIARYGAFALTWLIVGEYNINNEPSRVAKALELGRFIKDLDPYKRAMTINPWHYAWDKRQAWSESWYDFIMLQGGHDATLPPTSLYSSAYDYKPTKPVLEGESSFEGIKDISVDRVRMAAYRAIQSGAFGYTYGAQGLWYPTQNVDDTRYSEWGKPLVWWKALDLPGATQMRYLRSLYESVEWWNLEPRPNAVFSLAPILEDKRILAKAKGDELFVVYFPPRLDPEFKQGLLGTDPNATYSSQWFNPRNGQVQTRTEGFERDRRLLLLPSPPSREDWILVLRKSR